MDITCRINHSKKDLSTTFGIKSPQSENIDDIIKYASNIKLQNEHLNVRKSVDLTKNAKLVMVVPLSHQNDRYGQISKKP
jgi:hypothetical protein